MNAARSSDGLLNALLSRLMRPLQGKAWFGAATVVFCCAVGVGTYQLWTTYGGRVLEQPRYRLNPERLVVTPQPAWIKQTDVIQSAVTHGRLNQANLLDDALVLQVRQAFGVQPWVKTVHRVNKRYPSTVEVDLEYRRPIAMVEVAAGMFPEQDYEGLLPVDEEGYLLPVECTQEEAAGFPKISGIDTSPVGPPGNPWGDPRVADAARIALLLQDLWKKLDLYQIEVPPQDAALPAEEERHFVLITRKRRRFNWKSAPGKEVRGEPSAREKLMGLQSVVDEHGTLDAWQRTDEAKVDELLGRTKRR